MGDVDGEGCRGGGVVEGVEGEEGQCGGEEGHGEGEEGDVEGEEGCG